MECEWSAFYGKHQDIGMSYPHTRMNMHPAEIMSDFVLLIV